APCIVVVAPWVGARLDGIEAVVTFSISQATCDTIKVWVQRCWPGVVLVAVASSSIRLPYLNQCIGDGLVIPAGDLAVNQDALAAGMAPITNIPALTQPAQCRFTQTGADGFARWTITP